MSKRARIFSLGISQAIYDASWNPTLLTPPPQARHVAEEIVGHQFSISEMAEFLKGWQLQRICIGWV